MLMSKGIKPRNVAYEENNWNFSFIICIIFLF